MATVSDIAAEYNQYREKPIVAAVKRSKTKIARLRNKEANHQKFKVPISLSGKVTYKEITKKAPRAEVHISTPKSIYNAIFFKH